MAFLNDSSVCQLRMKRREFTNMLNEHLNLKLALAVELGISIDVQAVHCMCNVCEGADRRK
jgi:hypothetical protein